MIKKRLQNTDKQKEGEKKNHPLDLTTHNSQFHGNERR